MLRVVLDTSSLISYALTRGALMQRVVEYWRDGAFTVVSSPATRDELAAVLARPRIQQLSVVPLDELVNGLEQYSEHVPGNVSAAGVCRDPNDDKFLACALEGHAHYLMTSDRDLLDLRRHQNLAVVNPGQLLLAVELYDLTERQMAARFDRGILAEIGATIPLEPETASRVTRAAQTASTGRS